MYFSQGWQSPLPASLFAFSVQDLCLSTAEGEVVFPLGFIYSFIRLLPVYWKSLIGLQSSLSCSQRCTVVLLLLFLWWWEASGANPPSPPCLQAVERPVVHLWEHRWNGNGQWTPFLSSASSTLLHVGFQQEGEGQCLPSRAVLTAESKDLSKMTLF